MIFFLHGEDTFLVNRRKQTLMRAFVKKYSGAELFVFDFEDQGGVEDVKRALSATEGGLFTTDKMVVFLHPFSLGESAEKLLVDFLKQQKKKDAGNVILLFVALGKVKKTHPVVGALQKVVDTEEVFPFHTPKEEISFVEKELKARGEARFSREALELFLLLTRGNSAKQVSEIEKLTTYKSTGVIEKEDVLQFTVGLDESVIFTALDALGRGERKQALFLFRQEEKKSEVFQLLSMCAWQVRRILTVREAFDGGKRRAGDIASATKLPPFAVEKIMRSLQYFSIERIKNGLMLLSELDTDLKRGKKDPSVALDLFIWKF